MGSDACMPKSLLYNSSLPDTSLKTGTVFSSGAVSKVYMKWQGEKQHCSFLQDPFLSYTRSSLFLLKTLFVFHVGWDF